MGFTIGGRGGGGGSLAVRNSHIFADNAARDTYFAANSSEKVKDLTIKVADKLQKNIDDVWVEITPVIQGPTGSDAPQIKIEYSADGLDGWDAALNTYVHKYWRWSTDGGMSWSPTPPETAKFNAAGGSSGSGVPDPYELKVSPEGKLQLWKDTKLIQEQDEFGTWISRSVQTGVGSFHLGEAHSISSTGQNVGFKNEYSKANEAEKLFFYPTWEALSVDGLQTINASTLKYGPLTQVQPNGAVTAINVPYNFSINSTSNFVVFNVTVVPAEDYVGKILNIIYSNVSGEEIYNTVVEVNLTAGVEYTILYKYPFFVRTGDTLNLRVNKFNGNPLLVKAGATNTSVPWRRLSQRSFEDSEVLNVKEPAKVARALETLTDTDALDVFKLKNVGLLSKGNYRGELPATLADLTNSLKGDWWKASTAKTLNGVSIAIGDELYCTVNTPTTPTNLTNFSIVPNVNQVMMAATDADNGQAGIVPTPIKGDAKVLTSKGWGVPEYRDETTNKKYKLVIDNGIPYLEELV